MGRSRRLPESTTSEQSPLGEALAAVGGGDRPQPGAGRRRHRLHRRAVLCLGERALVPAAFPFRRVLRDARQQLCRTAGSDCDETTIRIERQSEAATPVAKPDPVVEQVQSILQSMNLYDGDVDGVNGPNTRKAIAAYRKTMGMEVSGEIDDALLEQLGAGRHDRRHHAEAA